MAMISNNTRSFIGQGADGVEPVSLRPINVNVVHSSIFNRFTKRFSIEEFNSYEKVRQICSLDDLAMNVLIGNMIDEKFSGWLVSTVGYDHKFIDPCFMTAMTPEQRSEWNRVLSFHTKQSGVIDTATAFLSPKKYMEEKGIKANTFDSLVVSDVGYIGKREVATLPYRVVVYQNSIYIVVEEGFLEQMEDKASKLKFISDVLKTAYSVMPINTVNRSQWYSVYLDTLI